MSANFSSFPSTTFSGIIDRAPQPAQFSNQNQSEERMSAKYIFVTGGVVSSLGKGLAAASIGCLLESRGLKVNLMKFDPYLNVDPGTMSLFQHGEVFVTDDGAETDLDLGHYERFTHANSLATTTGPLAAFMSRSSPRSGAAITWEKLSR